MNFGFVRSPMLKGFQQAALGLVFAWALAGCGGGGGGGGTTPVTPPALTVTGSTPAASATGVPVNSVITVTYSDTLTSTPSFVVSAGGNVVAGTVSRSGATASFTATLGFAPNTAVSVSVSGATGGGGSRQEAAHVFGFSTQAPAVVVVSGKAEYEFVPSNALTGGLSYANAVFKPIRGATVQIVSAASGAVLATGATDAQGNYSVEAPTGAALFARVRAQSVRDSAQGNWNYSVQDNTSGNAVYVLDSARATPNGAAVTLNLRAGSGWTGAAYGEARSAAPFAILDVAFEATQKILGVSPGERFPALRFNWSPNNRPVDGDETRGEIGTTFFRLRNAQHDIFVLGAANTDTDEYDRMVLAHEFGHYLQAAFSRDDSIGGSHSGLDKLDMRVAFSEGFGNAWSGMLYNTPLYNDSLGSQQASGGRSDFSVTPTNRGWFSSATVQHLLYTWHSDTAIGFEAIWQVLRGFRTSLTQQGVLTTLHSFAHQLKLQRPGRSTVIDSALAGQLVTVADALGSTETNNGGIAQALPIYTTLVLGTPQNVCVTDAAGAFGDEFNKLGSHAFLRINLPSLSARTITVVGSNSASDPDFTLIRSDGQEIVYDDGVTSTETVSAALSAGWHVLAVYDYALTAGSSGASQSGVRCFNVTVQ